MLDFNNNRKIITFDNTANEIKCYVSTGIKPGKYIFADGSFSEKNGKGAYAVIIKDKIDSKKSLLYGEIIEDATDSNQVELLASIKGLELADGNDIVRLHTDSRYVKKGITEWIFYWQVNDWTTTNGTRAKHIDLWKYFLELTSGRIIQFVWIKGHSDANPENKLCDYYAKSLLTNADD
jgi:ribonuclease HI